jgi:hypothetical protein
VHELEYSPLQRENSAAMLIFSDLTVAFAAATAIVAILTLVA